MSRLRAAAPRVAHALVVALLLATPLASPRAQVTRIDSWLRAGDTTLVGLGHFTYADAAGRRYDAMGHGQSFRAPTSGATSLDRFTFFLNDDFSNPGSPLTDFRAYVVAWDAGIGRPTGELLWRSDRRTGSTTPYLDPSTGMYAFEPYTFATGGLTLDPGRFYLAFLSTVEELAVPGGDGVYHFTALGAGVTGQGAGGGLVHLMMRDRTPGALTGAQLADASVTEVRTLQGMDAGFVAEFGVPQSRDMPGPAALPMLVLGLAAMGPLVRRRREGGA
jgi:hypothetical protein